MMMSVNRLGVALAASIPVSLAGVSPAPAQTGELYAADVSSYALWTVDRDTANCTFVGNFGDIVQGLAYDANHDVLYGVSASSDCIFRINRETGRATIIGGVGALGYDNTNGLAYDPNHDILYATDNNTNTLMTVDVQTGVGSPIGQVGGGFREIEGLGYDPVTDTLYGLTDLDRRIVRIDVVTAEAEAVSDVLPDYVWRGLTFDTERRVLWATQVDPYGNPDPRGLWSFDPVTGELIMVGETDELGSPQGLAWVELTEGFALNIVGDCPGRMSAVTSGGEPGDLIAIIYGRQLGEAGPVPGCPGLFVDIENPVIAGRGRADAQGEFSLEGRVPAAACGRVILQAVNVTMCAVSETVSL